MIRSTNCWALEEAVHAILSHDPCGHGVDMYRAIAWLCNTVRKGGRIRCSDADDWNSQRQRTYCTVLTLAGKQTNCQEPRHCKVRNSKLKGHRVRENKNVDPQLWPSAAPSEGHWRIQGQLRRKSVHWHGGMEETAPPRTSDQYSMLLRGIPCLLSRFPCDSDSWRRSRQVCNLRNVLHWERGDGW